MKKIELYLLFNFFLAIIFYYLGEEFVLFAEIILVFTPFIFALFSLIFLLVKRKTLKIRLIV